MRVDLVEHEIANLKITHAEIFEDEEAWDISLSSETSFDEAITTLLKSIDDAGALIAGTRLRMDELAARKARFERRVEACRALILKLMQAAEVTRRELPLATVSLRQGTEKIVITDEALLPDAVCKFVRRADLAKVKAVLLQGVPLAGAALVEPGQTLTIRTR